MLTMAACSQDKSADTATTDTTTTTTSTDASGSGSAAMGGYSDADYNSRADRIASDMATKMKLDEATREKVRTAYYNRSKRLGELHNQYSSDTTGMAAAMREVYTDTDAEMKQVFTDPTQYSTYESSRTEYIEDRYMTTPNSMSDGTSTSADGSMSSDESMASDASTSSSDMNADMSTSTSSSSTTTTQSSGSGMSGVAVEKAKIKDAAGNKLKVKDNGKVKTKVGD
jgi:hypothetical protein